MITIDRDAATPVHEQLVEQLRYLVASGHHAVGATMPSTRVLGKQVGVSFHTVRKAYQALEQEGLLEARTGSGYVVKEAVPLGKGERMERGAAVIHDALQRLLGLGLTPAEVEHLVQERLGELALPSHQKLVLAAPFREMAEQLAEQVRMVLQRSVEGVAYPALERHRDADHLFAPMDHLRQALELVPRADAHGYVSYLHPDVLEQTARLLDHETLGLVTRYADAIPHLTRDVRDRTGYRGQVLAASTEDGGRHLDALLDQMDFLLYTPGARRRLLPHLSARHRHAELRLVLSRESLETIKQVVPST